MAPDSIHPNAQTLLIDDLGHERDWPPGELAATFGRADPEFDPVAYAVRDLGYIIVSGRGDSLRIAMRPLLVSNRAVAALCYFLAERRPQRTAISWFADQWHHDVCGDLKSLFRQIARILESSVKLGSSEPFLAARRNLDGILKPAGHPFAALLQRWTNGPHTEDVALLMRQNGIWDRAMIAERDPDDGGFVIRHSGQALRVYGADWHARAVGRRLTDQPDAAFGAWIAKTCADVDESGEARAELVHANIDGPNGRQPFRYERLLLPWQLPDGRRQVISVSTVDPGPGR